MGYSVAIRTLGTSGEKFVRELKSIYNQTVQPEKVIVYIAEGYPRPSNQIGGEEYVWVKKGMVSQRALEYREIESDVILMLDDDVELALNSAERMLKAMEDNVADCIAADTFKNQEMTWREKLLAFLSNWVYARRDDGWAFKQNRDGSFSFNGNPRNSFCQTETFAGPCWMVKREVLKAVPRLDLPKDSPLVGIAGTVPPPTDWPTGCAFHPRCPKATPECARAVSKSCMSALR